MEEDRALLKIDLSKASLEVIGLLIEDSSDSSIFEEIMNSNLQRPEILRLLIKNPNTPDEIRQQTARALQIPVKTHLDKKGIHETYEAGSRSMLQRIQKLSIAEKIHLALRGNKEIRAILLRDPSKEIVSRVLENPKITEGEVELLTRSRLVSEEILRKVTKKKEWMKNYSIILGLVTNPKTPPGIAVTLVSELKIKDLVIVAKSRNVLEGIRAAAKKYLRARKAH